jgi:hypothetical protein
VCAEIVASTFAVRRCRDIPGAEADDCCTATEGTAYCLALRVCLFLTWDFAWTWIPCRDCSNQGDFMRLSM